MTSCRVQRGAFPYENPSIWPESEQESKNHFEIKVMNISFFRKANSIKFVTTLRNKLKFNLFELTGLY